MLILLRLCALCYLVYPLHVLHCKLYLIYYSNTLAWFVKVRGSSAILGEISLAFLQIICSTLCCHQTPKRGRLKEHFHPYYVLMIVNNTMSILTYVLSTADKSYAHVVVFLEDLVSHFRSEERRVGKECRI